jgi:hypothetical protein
MRPGAYALAVVAILAAESAVAHGPQIQLTNDGGKIVTRQVFENGPYSTTLSPITSVYVMPLLGFDGVLYSRPNNEIDPILNVAAFPSGPGFAYGYDLADGGPQLFESGSTLTLTFTTSFERWDGAAFVDAGATQFKAFRGSNVNITSPPENFATTSGGGPFDSLSLPTVATNYGSEGAEVHTSLRFAMLGDGADPLSTTPNGVYRVGLQLSSSQNGLAPSDPYYFVLYKNVSAATVTAAIDLLGIPAGRIQWTAVPEPATAILFLLAIMLANVGRLGRSRRSGQP